MRVLCFANGGRAIFAFMARILHVHLSAVVEPAPDPPQLLAVAVVVVYPQEACLFSHSDLIYKSGQDFLGMQYLYIIMFVL